MISCLYNSAYSLQTANIFGSKGGRMKVSQHRLVGFVIFLSVLLLFATSTLVSADVEGKVLGTVAGTKGASVLTPFGSWVPVGERLYPAVDGTSLRSGEGIFSLQLKDSTKVEASPQTELALKGARGAYEIRLEKGSVLFRVPQGVSAVVVTPTARVVVPAVDKQAGKAITSSTTDRIGTVSFDGDRSKVFCSNGEFSVANASGSERQVLARGVSAVVSGAGGAKIELAQGGVGKSVTAALPAAGAAVAGVGAGVAVTAAQAASSSSYLVPAGSSISDDVGAHMVSPRRLKPRPF